MDSNTWTHSIGQSAKNLNSLGYVYEQAFDAV